MVALTGIVFLGDNGGAAKSHANNRFRVYKASFYDGGVRVPFAMQWPGMLPEGVRYEHQVSSISGTKPEEVERLRNAYRLWNSEMDVLPAFPPKKK